MYANNSGEYIQFPLTEPQKRIYVSESLHRGTSINNICVSYFIEEEGNQEALFEAFSQVLLENEGLRLRVSANNGDIFQYISPYKAYEWEITNFFENGGKQRQQVWQNECARTPIVLFDSPLFDFLPFWSYDGYLSFILKTHHIISDAWTHQLITDQVKNHYNKLLSGENNTSINRESYLSFLNTEQIYLDSNRYTQDWNFWKDLLNPLPDRLNLGKNPESKSSEAERFEFYFPTILSESVVSFCKESNMSLSNFFLSVLAILLFKITNKNDFLIGTLTHNRIGKKEKSMLGMFVNTLPIRLALDGDQNLSSFSKKISQNMTSIMRHQRVPISHMKNTQSGKLEDPQTMIEVLFTYENAETPFEHNLHFCGYENYPILFRPSRRGSKGPFKLEIDYQLDQFSNDQIKYYAEGFEIIAKQLISGKDHSIHDLQWFSENTRNKILDDFNHTEFNHIIDETIHKAFELEVGRNPSNQAISDEDISLSYSELNIQANRLAHYLINLGAGRDISIGILMERSVDMMIAILAILKSGSAYLPLSTEQPSKRSDLILEDSNTNILICKDYDFSEIHFPRSIIDLDEIDLSDEDEVNPEVSISPNDLAYVIYTSGSTGKPKGVMVEHRSVINRLKWMQEKYPLDESDTVLQKTPYTFDVSVWEFFGWFHGGAKLHFLAPGGEKEPDTILETVRQYQITIIHFVPSMLSVFLEYLNTGASIAKLKSLRRVNCSGEALLPKHSKIFWQLIGKSYDTMLLNLYGPTEATVEVSYYKCNDEIVESIPIGKPIDNVKLYVLDKQGRLLPPEIPGELYIGGECLARGYLNQKELTEERFVKDPYRPGGRMYKTGDLVSWMGDGNIKYLGRIDNQVKIRGNRVEIGEIENKLLELSSIKESAVVARPDHEGNLYLGAYFIADDPLDHSDLRHFLIEELPSYMIPAHFTQVEKFPLTSSGKLDRKALPDPIENEKRPRDYVAPRDSREETIAEAWEDVLNRENIGVHDNFFDLGGDSLKLIRIHGLLKQQFEINVQDVFEYQTIETLSQHIHNKFKKTSSIRKKAIITRDQNNILNPYFREINKLKRYHRENAKLLQIQKLPLVNMNHILLTGATGFLGSYILKELLETTNAHIYPLVRSHIKEMAEIRLKSVFDVYFGSNFLDGYSDRITIIAGDIQEHHLGIDDDQYGELCSSLDTIIHSAADVRHFGKYEGFKRTNIEGTKNVFQIAKDGQDIQFHHMSTISIGLSEAQEDAPYLFTEDDRLQTKGIDNPYIRSKIEAEQFLLKQDKAVNIYRLGNLVYDNTSGQFQQNIGENAFYRTINAYLKIGYMPSLENEFIDFSFINETASAICKLARIKNTKHSTYHVYNPDMLSLVELSSLIGVPHISMEEFVNKFSSDDDLYTHAPYLTQPEILNVVPFNDRTTNCLQRLGFSWNPVDSDSIEIMKNYASKVGFFSP